jgi:para-nitrobenzyl esterase
MHFAQIPEAQIRLMLGMYELNEEVVCRRRHAGDIGWNWNVGLASPKLPPATPACDAANASGR